MGQIGSIWWEIKFACKTPFQTSYCCDDIRQGSRNYGGILLNISFEISYFAARKEHLQGAFKVAKMNTTSYSFRFVALD